MTQEERRRADWGRRDMDDFHKEYLAFNKKVVGILAFMFAVMVICLALLGYYIKQNYDKNKDIHHLAIAAANQAREAKEQSAAIQDNRRAVILQNCSDTNRRHDATIRALKKLLAQAEKGPNPPSKKQAEQSIYSTELLINALVPHRDCDAYTASVLSRGVKK